MRTQRQYSSVRLPGAGLLLIGLIALTAVFMGHDVARAQFAPNITVALSTQAPGANPEISSSLDISAPQPNFAAIISFTPPEFTVPKAEDMPIGAVVAELTSVAVLGLINGPCSTPIGVEFTFLNASTDITNTIDPLPQGASDRLQVLRQDTDPVNGIADGADRYPSYLKDPDVFGNTKPRARYFGATTIPEAMNLTVILNFVFFDLGVTPNPDIPLDARLGYPNVTVLQDPTEVGASVITDFCSPLAADTTVFPLSKDNTNTGVDESGHVVRQNPASDGTFNFLNWARSQRDADGDGLENTLDTCPFIPTNVEDPRQPAAPIGTGDPDLDAIDSACDPDPANLCWAGPPGFQGTDCDGDEFLNRGDNCPQVPNADQADDDDDGIGDVCDIVGAGGVGQGPNVADGVRTDICAVNQITIGAGGPAPSGAIAVGATTCPPASVAVAGGGDGGDGGGDGGPTGGGLLTEEQLATAVETTAAAILTELDEDLSIGEVGLGIDPVKGFDTTSTGTSAPLVVVCAEKKQSGLEPVSGEEITFKIDSQPGSDASLEDETATTDAEGSAVVTLNVGSTTGDIVVSAFGEGCGDAKTVTLTVVEAGPATGVGSLAPAIASIPAWAAIASGLGGAGLLGGLGALASRVLRRRRQ